ncbi:MFS transporter [Streptomyces sp. NPDC047108]|uniref:MFS transporter n=1 Tax=Streptomyces sp. NPDC047108 TaxID=3155025 RepID=UPI0033D2DF7E
MIVALDGTVLTIVQPVMQRDLDASFSEVQWTSTRYLIAVAGLLVFSGRLGDRYGHQRVFAVGVLGFAATSAAIGVASDIDEVIALRVAQGVCGALLQPATLGMLRAAYPRDRLAMPIALRTSAIGVAAACGPLLGGALAAHLGWRAVFFLTVAPALAAGVAALAVRMPQPAVPIAPDARAGLDLPGAGLLAVALGFLVHTLVVLPEPGGTGASATGFVAVVAASVAFVRHERRTPSALVQASVIRSAAVRPALGVLVIASAVMFGALFIGTYYLQDVLGLDPLQSSLNALPGPVMMILGAPVSAVLSRRQGHRLTAVSGMVLIAVGVLLLSGLDQGSASTAIGGAFLVLGAGFGMVMVTATAVIVHQCSKDTAGVAGGLQQTAMNIGPAVGIAAATMFLSPVDAPHRTGAAFLSTMEPALVALATTAALGALLAARLPGHRATSRR